MKRMTLTVPCPLGTEAIVAHQIRDCGYETSLVVDGSVSFEGDEEALIDFCRLRKAKCGSMYCYTPQKDEMLTAEEWEGFDFENIWAMQNGRPVPQIFAYRASK